MTFESLCKIVRAEPLNAPSVNAYEKIETKAHLIKRGDLFVGSDKEAITQAIENGAYGILHEGTSIMIDEEVAWLRVDSTDEALVKLLRFSLLNSELIFAHFTPIQYALLKKIAPKELLFLEDSISFNFKKILLAEKNVHFISTDESFLKQIYPDFTSYHDREITPIQLTHKSLFLSSFTYHDRHYEDIKIPSLFIEDLTLVLAYLDENDFAYNLEKLDFTQYFQPLFISNQLTIRPFGDSEHAFILQEDIDTLLPSLTYIESLAPWAKVLLFIPEDTTINTQTETYHYESLEEVNKLTIDDFNFILILANYNALTLVLKNNKKEKFLSLFQDLE